MKEREYVSIDPGSIWGSFHGGTFKLMLKFGYLPEGSKWKNNRTGITYEIVGKQAPTWLGDEQRQPQKKVVIDD